MSAVKTKQYNLTEGGIMNKLLLIAVPIMGTQLLQMAYNLTDMFWLGRVSSEAVAASGTGGTYAWLSMAFMMIGRMGSEIGVAQNLGKGDKKTARRFAENALFLAVIFGVAFALFLIIFQRPLIGFFNIQEEIVVKYARDYLAIIAVGIPMTFVTGAVNGAFTGSGNSRMPFAINAVGLVVNMILDPLFILSFNMGIVGAAIATVIGQTIVCVIFLIALKVSKGRPFEEFSYRNAVKPDKILIRQIFKWSVPIAAESLFFTLLSMVISRFVAAYGAGAMAIQRVGGQVESLSWLIGGGFSSALTAFVGQNYGAGKWTRIRRGFRLSTIVMTLYGIGVTALLFFNGSFLYSLFLSEPGLIAAGAVYLKILSGCQVAAVLEGLAAGAFRGVGKTLPPSFTSVACNVVRIPIAYFLSQTSLGLNGIWLGLTLGGIMRGGIMFIWYLIVDRKQPREDLPLLK